MAGPRNKNRRKTPPYPKKISYQYKAKQPGQYNIKLTVNDGKTSTSHTWTINIGRNQPPTAEVTPRKASISPGEEATYNGKKKDPDNYPGKLKGWFKTPWGIVKGDSYTVKADTLPEGSYTITYTVTDGQDTARAEATLNRNKGKPPQLDTNLGSVWTNLSQPYIVEWHAEDPEGQQVRVNLEVILGQDTTRISRGAQGEENLTKYLQKEGAYTIIITAKDTDGDKEAEQGTVHVDKTPPVINWETTTSTIPARGFIKARVEDASPTQIEKAGLTRTTDNHEEEASWSYKNNEGENQKN